MGTSPHSLRSSATLSKSQVFKLHICDFFWCRHTCISSVYEKRMIRKITTILPEKADDKCPRKRKERHHSRVGVFFQVVKDDSVDSVSTPFLSVLYLALHRLQNKKREQKEEKRTKRRKKNKKKKKGKKKKREQKPIFFLLFTKYESAGHQCSI